MDTATSDPQAQAQAQAHAKPQPQDETTVKAPPQNSTSTEEFVPQLAGITVQEMETAIKVLAAVSLLNPKKRKSGDEDGLELYKQSNLRPLRKAITDCLEIQKRCMFQGKSEEDHYDSRIKERSLKRQRKSEADMQKKYIAQTALRRGRMDRLKQKQDEAKDEEMEKMQMMIPDGHVDTIMGDVSTPLLTNSDDVAPQSEGAKDETVNLPKLRSCYVCKARFRELHHFYDQLCPTCAPLNWEKRHQTASLKGRVAVVTGSRVKIGYQTCLKLLRAGAFVVATTRFPNSAAETYRKEPDFHEWKDQLQIYGLDFRDVTGLEAFTRFLKMKFPDTGIDMLINNACQTIRRPRGYYVPIAKQEQDIWKAADDTHKMLLTGCVEFERLRRKISVNQNNSSLPIAGSTNSASATPLIETDVPSSKDTADMKPMAEGTIVVKKTSKNESVDDSPFETMGVSHSTALSQMVVLPEDVGVSDAILPEGVTDINGQQLDLRTTNSWLLKLEEVSTPEVMECMFINTIAPFVLNSRLKPLMTIPENRPDRYIINVSAMEGKFNRFKLPNHVHSNMAKAALNMMTRTSAEDLAKNHRIFMNSVDTGWINDENPLHKANKTAATNNFQTPIDEIDAASRILDPVFDGVNNPSKPKDYGKFLKDYAETDW